VDVETGEEFRPTDPGVYQVILQEQRLRMLYAGPKRR
jgi:hypothetical protein